MGYRESIIQSRNGSKARETDSLNALRMKCAELSNDWVTLKRAGDREMKRTTQEEYKLNDILRAIRALQCTTEDYITERW